MKKIIALVGLFVGLTACASQPQLSDREYECASLAHRMDKPSEWLEKCKVDDNLYLASFMDFHSQKTPEQLCAFQKINALNESGVLIKKIITKKKVNCSTYEKEWAARDVNALSMESLCQLWSTSSPNSLSGRAAQKEVATRNLNCPQLLTSMSQKEAVQAQKRQAEALEKQVEQQKREATAARIEKLLKPKSSNTNCYTYGNSVNCTTQ